MELCRDLVETIFSFSTDFELTLYNMACGEEGPLAKEVLCEEAARRNNLSILKYLIEDKIPVTEVTVAQLVKHGNLEELKWLKEKINKGECNFVVLSCNHNLVCNYASKFGQLDCLEWLLENGYSFCEKDAILAAEGGFLEILKLLHTRGLKLDFQVMEAAAKGGSVEVVEFLLSKNCPKSGYECLHCAHRGHLPLLKYFVSRGWRVNSNTFCQGSLHVEVMEYLSKLGCRAEPDTVRYLCRTGNLNSIKWLWKKYPARRQELFISNSCSWCACCSGSIELIKWLEKKGEIINSSHFSLAIISGNVELLKILREKGATVDEGSMSDACCEGHIPVLEYLKELSCEYDGTCYLKAGESSNLEVLEWLKENGYYLKPSARYSTEELKTKLLACGSSDVIERDPLAFEKDIRSIRDKNVYDWIRENMDSIIL